jgi:hypothetical protein
VRAFMEELAHAVASARAAPPLTGQWGRLELWMLGRLMTAEFSIALAATSALILLARLVLPQLPVSRVAVRITPGDAVLVGLGTVGLAFHCTAMFSRHLFDVIPVAKPLVEAVNAMSLTSIVLYVVPALLLLIGLRRQHWVALTTMALALIAVGLTMYLGSPLRLHLITIFISVVVLVGVVSLLIKAPWNRKPESLHNQRA